jgi:hypothetical protein
MHQPVNSITPSVIFCPNRTTCENFEKVPIHNGSYKTIVFPDIHNGEAEK